MRLHKISNVMLGAYLSMTGCSSESEPSCHEAEARGYVRDTFCNLEDKEYRLYLKEGARIYLKDGGSETRSYTFEVLHYFNDEKLCDRIKPVPQDAEVWVRGMYHSDGWKAETADDYFSSRRTLQLSPEERQIWPVE